MHLFKNETHLPTSPPKPASHLWLLQASIDVTFAATRDGFNKQFTLWADWIF